MQWKKILTSAVLLGFQMVWSQAYIIKFKSEIADSAIALNLIREKLSKTKSQTSQTVSFSLKLFNPRILPSKSKFPWKKYFIARFPQKQSGQFLQSIASNSSVEYIQPSYIYRVYSVPNDSAYSSQWNLRRIGISSLFENATINSSLPVVKVGVIDTGIDDDHPDLVNSISINSGEIGGGKETNSLDDDGNGFIDDWKGYDFVDSESEDTGDWNERDNDPNDENGHGTSVSGIIGAQSNNAVGLSGIFPAKILPLRAFGKNGNGSDIDIASAIVYAVDNGVDVINMSFGDVVQSPLLHDAIRYAYSQNVILVASSGNDGSNYPHYPSDFSEVISTGSVGTFDSRSFFSSYSPSLDLMAPGEQIVTTTIGGGYTDQFAGTSAASPHVAGVSALLKSLEKQKKNSNSNYIELSNEEIRGILLNSSDDAGEKGWDKFYGAGIVNAARAIQAVSGSTVIIHSPTVDEILDGSTSPIIISASTPYLHSVQLYYGAGDNPNVWSQIASIENKIFVRDTIAHWNTAALDPNVYILRLVVHNSKGNDIEFRQRIVIDSSNPKILSFRFRDSVIIGNEYGGLIEARVDRNSTGTLFYRKVGKSQYKTLHSLGLQTNHSFVLSSKDLIPLTDYEFYCQFTENSAKQRTVKFPTVELKGFDHYSIRLRALPFNPPNFVQKPFTLPAGFLLNSVQTLNGLPTVILNEYNSAGDFGKLKAYQFNGTGFTAIDSSIQSWVPRSFVKNSGEGKPAILVQDRGVSQLLQVDTVNGKFFSQPIWGDSSDVWASQLVDLDGDNKPEIVARNSSEFLIYKNLGGNKFSLSPIRLHNPSSPLSGEARNQFGPPKCLVGNFTGLGQREIIFADYDGDMIMYRQTTPDNLNFEFAGIDSTNLYEMSDYLTAGDFNGDGIMDFAVAGHSNLDWNQDREYNIPVWTVRIFAHQMTDPAGKVSIIWEQDFVGVKAGSGYDNGITAVTSSPNGNSPDDLFLSLNPNGYIFRFNPIAKRFLPAFYHSMQTNSTIAFDFDSDGWNDIGFVKNGQTEFWSSRFSTTQPEQPFALALYPLEPTAIRLRWSSYSIVHNIYRGTHIDSLKLLSSNFSGPPEFIDSTVSLNTKYYYAVTSISTRESGKSKIESITPHNAATITFVEPVSLNQLVVGLSFDVSPENLLTSVFILDSSIMSSSVIWKSSRSLMMTFPRTIDTGKHTLKIQQLTDASGMGGDTNQAFIFTSTLQDDREFFVRSVKLLSANRIQIEFSEQPNMTEARTPSNYTIKTIAKQFSVLNVDSISSTSVNLNFSSGTNLSELALRLEIKVSESIRSLLGTKLNAGKGQVLSIAQETQSIDNIVVYPNPVKNSQQVSFVNIPGNCKITIFSTTGEKIKIFDHVTTNEGIFWNLRDEKGDIVGSGIYIYRVEQMNGSNEVSNTKIGKFAVIR